LPLVALLLVPAVAYGGFRASSFKKETRLGANYWNAASALDGNVQTCWQVDPEAENAGQWFEIDLPKSEVDKLGMITGWEKDEESRKDFPRVKSVRIELFGSAENEEARVLEHNLTFEDKAGWQVLDLPDTPVGGELHGGRARITITDVYAGDDYPNLAVSEIVVHLKEKDVAKEAVKLKTAPTSAASGHDGEKLVDGDPRTYWAADGQGEQVFEVRAEGFGVSAIGIVSGNTGFGRPKTIEVTSNDITVKHTLADKGDVQWLTLPGVVGYTGSAWGGVAVKVIDSYPGKSGPGPAISDVKLRFTNFEGI
jgi:hypothetical protein